MCVCVFFSEATNHDTSKSSKPNGKLEEAVDTVSSPPRTTLLDTIFSPVFNYFSPANKNGEPYHQRENERITVK